MAHAQPGGFHRPSVRTAALFLVLWTGSLIAALIPRHSPSRSGFGAVGFGDHIPLYWIRYAADAFLTWMVVDLFFIRRAPPDVRKAQWATSILMILLLLTAGPFLESLTDALEWSARQD